MASSKQQPITKKDFLVLMDRIDQGFDAIDKRFNGVDKRFKSIDEHFSEQDDKILGLQFDTKELKRGQQEMIHEQKLVRNSLKTLNDRVIYQEDMPVRIKQLENDTHQLKLEVHRIKEKMSK